MQGPPTRRGNRISTSLPPNAQPTWVVGIQSALQECYRSSQLGSRKQKKGKEKSRERKKRGEGVEKKRQRIEVEEKEKQKRECCPKAHLSRPHSLISWKFKVFNPRILNIVKPGKPVFQYKDHLFIEHDRCQLAFYNSQFYHWFLPGSHYGDFCCKKHKID